jgi:uncharacterized membrane protein
MKIYNEILIARPVEEVFGFLADFTNMPKWNYYVVKVNKITEGPIGKGVVFYQQRKSDAQSYKIVKMTFPSAVSIETLPPERKLIMTFTLSQAGAQTKVEDAWEVNVPGLVAWFFRRKMQSAVMDNLQKLKVLLETGRVTLQDGRVETLN